MNASTEQPKDFTDVAVWLRSLHGVVIVLLMTASVIGNSLVLFLIMKLRRKSFVVSLGLVAADLVITLDWSTQSLGNVISGYYPFSDEGCSIMGAVQTVAIHARWCTVVLISIDRFCYILFPFWYKKWNKPLLITLTVMSWITPSAMLVPWLAGFGKYEFRLEHSSCSINCGSDKPCLKYYSFMYGFFVCIGGFLPTVLYLSLCIFGQRIAYRMKNMHLGTVTNPISTSNKEICPEQSSPSSKESTSSSLTSSRWKSERKALITFLMTFINIFFTQLPILITSILRNNKSIYEKIPLWVHFIAIYIYLLGAVLDPLLIMRNKYFKEIINKRLRKRRTMNNVQKNKTLIAIFRIGSLQDVRSVNNVSNKRRNSLPSFMEKKLPIERS